MIKNNAGLPSHVAGGVAFSALTANFWADKVEWLQISVFCNWLLLGLVIAMTFEGWQASDPVKIKNHGGLEVFLDDAFEDITGAIIGGFVVSLILFLSVQLWCPCIAILIGVGIAAIAFGFMGYRWFFKWRSNE